VVPLGLLAQKPWQQVTTPSVREVAASFRTPPPDFGVLHWAIWGGELTKARIVRELDELHANGVPAIIIGPARGLSPQYLSPEYMELMTFTAQELNRRGMKAWIADEGTYPSGFAGGKISQDYPELGMKGLVVGARLAVAPGETITRKLTPDTLGVLAVNRADGRSMVVDVRSGELNWTAPPGDWVVQLIQWQFKSAPTRYVHHPMYAKTTTNSLIDYLDPEATRAFIKTTHEAYKKAFGPEMWSKVALGFFSDEPDFADFTPWTPKMLEEFQKRKGYDVQPYLPWFFAPKVPEEARRVQADYWDVWSDLWRDSFGKVLADWCAANGVQELAHLTHEENLMWEVHSQGNFLKLMRYVTVPGIDERPPATPGEVWVIPPKLPSSTAHLFGRAEVWDEYGGALTTVPEQGKFQMDHLLLSGINLLTVGGLASRGGGAAPAGQPVPASPWRSAFARYGNRGSYLMTIGRPAAQIAVYDPVTSMYLGDEDAYRGQQYLAQELLEHQLDFDFIDEDALASVVVVEKGGLKNLSGQTYRAVIVSPVTVISQAALDRLKALVSAGGRVIFLGRTPRMVVEKSFLKAGGPPDLSWAMHEQSEELTPRVLEALPRPDVALDQPCPAIKYSHKTWRDAEMYFFYNESDQRQSRTVTVAGGGQAQVWDALSARIYPLAGATAKGDRVQLPLVLEPCESKFIVVGALAPGLGPAQPAFASVETVLDLTGDWAVDLNGKQLTTPLKSWADLGSPSFPGPARYRKEFTAPAGRKHLYLDCGDVRYWARVRLNGVDLDVRAFRPFRWDLAKALKSGKNVLEIEVLGSPGSEARPMLPPAGAAAAPAGRGGRAAAPPSGGLLPPVRLISSN